MLYEIKVLKAPWPAGAKVGDVVDMPYLPAWAQGKCNIAEDGAQATIEFVEPVAADGVNRPLSGDGSGQALPSVESINAELEQARGDLKDAQAHAHEQARQIERLQAEQRNATARADELRAQLGASEARATALQAKLDAAETEEGKATAALKEAEQQAASERAAAETKAKAKK